VRAVSLIASPESLSGNRPVMRPVQQLERVGGVQIREGMQRGRKV
jgi:hypothetical protein